MGARGPVGASRETLKLSGDSRHRRRGDTLEFPVDKPSCPSWLDDEAKKMWRLVAGELEAAGAMSRAYLGVLTAYCLAWSELVSLTAKIVELEKAEADPKAIWHVRVDRGKADERLRQSAQQLGLTPASCGRVKVVGSREEEKPRVAARKRG